MVNWLDIIVTVPEIARLQQHIEASSDIIEQYAEFKEGDWRLQGHLTKFGQRNRPFKLEMEIAGFG